MIVFDKTVLLGALKPLGQCDNYIPILSTVRICDDGPEHVRLTATDLEVWHEVRVPFLRNDGELPKEGICISLKRLKAFAGHANKVVSIKFDTATEDVVLENEIAEYLPLWQGGEGFPKLLADRSKVAKPAFKIPAQFLRNILCTLRPFASRDEVRYYLNGVYVGTDTGALTFVATDGARLGQYHAGPVDPFEGFILPLSSISVLIDTLSGYGDEGVGVALLPNLSDQKISHAVFSFEDGRRIIVNLIDGTFPDYKKLFKNIPDEETTLNVGKLRRILALAGSISAFRDAFLEFRVHPERAGMLWVSGARSIGGPFSSDLPFSGRPPESTVAYNLKYLQDCLNAVPSGYVDLSISSYGTALPTRIVHGKVPGFTQLLMPRRPQASESEKDSK